MVEHGRWRIEPSKEGIPLVFGDDRYPHDPPRIASELESSLADAYAGAVSRLEAWADDLMRYADTFDHSPEMVRAVAVEMRAVASGQSPRPARTSRTQALSVECPHCGAGPGEPCVGARDKPRTSMHRERHDALGRQR